MEVGHLLLGRPWKYDRKIIYNGLTNEITLTHLGTKFMLHPQTPSQVAKDQLTISSYIQLLIKKIMHILKL